MKKHYTNFYMRCAKLLSAPLLDHNINISLIKKEGKIVLAWSSTSERLSYLNDDNTFFNRPIVYTREGLVLGNVDEL